jgi:hypothetical protein
MKLTKMQLQELIREEIQRLNGSGDFSWVTLREIQMLEELNYNLEDTYPIINELPFNIEFKDNKNRLNVTKGKLNNGFIEIKLYWVDDEGKVRMDSSEGISPKTMNTHMSNIINKFLPNYDQFLIRPNDNIRFRLFQLLLNRYIDKNDYKITFHPERMQIFITVWKN